MPLQEEVTKRRTFAIISHPDAGKTTLTEKLLLFGGLIQKAGTVKAKKTGAFAASDWMAMEQERGISVTSSVMQFPYNERIVNLLDTPGHADFSEDTYRVLTAVDSALMVIDVAKGVEERTIKLMDVCRLRDTPIYTFINKLDREGKEPIELLDEVETVLNIMCAPITWPVGMGKNFRGIYHLYEDRVYLYERKDDGSGRIIDGLDNPELDEAIGDTADELREEIELVRGASNEFDEEMYLAGELSPVFFGTALANFGITQMLDSFVENAPVPQAYASAERDVEPTEPKFSGFVFKIQANMDPKHRDRIAFMRVVSGTYKGGMKLRHVRIGKDIKTDALTFMAADRSHVDQAFPGDIIGLHNHGTIRIGDTMTEGENLKFTGIPNFAPEIFRRVNLRDPLKAKALNKGLDQLCEEGATQVFRPLISNDVILGAVGMLQFDVVASRLKTEYKVDSSFDTVPIRTARWVSCDDPKMFDDFQRKNEANLAIDHAGELVYLAPSPVNLQLAQERWPDVTFNATREQL